MDQIGSSRFNVIQILLKLSKSTESIGRIYFSKIGLFQYKFWIMFGLNLLCKMIGGGPSRSNVVQKSLKQSNSTENSVRIRFLF